ncbi:MAG: hypothetical protein K0S33_3977 [Bacteroidetes bacterium]|jgi:hypothetical protein|nr:hypothetical protein [Bacteroidota bacterium]
MKKKTALLLSICMLLVLAACSGSGKSGGWHSKHAKKRKGTVQKQR